MLCAWHTLKPFVINNGLVIICVRTYLFIYFYYAWWHYGYVDDGHKLFILLFIDHT